MIKDNGWYRHEDDTAFSQKLSTGFPITGATAFDKHEKILNDSLPTFLRNPNSKQIIKNQINNPNYIHMYLSSNVLMFIILFVLCEFRYIKTAWVILCISISRLKISQIFVLIYLNILFSSSLNEIRSDLNR